MGTWDAFFSHKPMKELVGFLTTYNMASQTIALDANANDIQSTGTGQCVINGVYIPSLTADAALDISADNLGDATGTTITTGYDQWFMITAKADGTLSVWDAGVQALTTTATCVVPDYDPSTYCVVAFMKVVNDSGSDIVIGTTALTGDATFYQVLGPIFPASANIDLN